MSGISQNIYNAFEQNGIKDDFAFDEESGTIVGLGFRFTCLEGDRMRVTMPLLNNRYVLDLHLEGYDFVIDEDLKPSVIEDLVKIDKNVELPDIDILRILGFNYVKIQLL